MTTCNVCGGAVFAAGTGFGYVGAVCPYSGVHPTYGAPATHQVGHYTFTPTPLTADDVRKIVREELERAKLGD